jgi:hypothetical protein
LSRLSKFTLRSRAGSKPAVGFESLGRDRYCPRSSKRQAEAGEGGGEAALRPLDSGESRGEAPMTVWDTTSDPPPETAGVGTSRPVHIGEVCPLSPRSPARRVYEQSA